MADTNYGRDVIRTISNELIGAIPVVGTALSATTSLLVLVGWYTDRQKEKRWNDITKIDQTNNVFGRSERLFGIDDSTSPLPGLNEKRKNHS